MGKKIGVRSVIGVLLIGVGLFFAGQSGCVKDGGRQQFNLFTMEQDMEFGQQLEKEIESKPKEYPLVPREKMPKVYEKLESICQSILESGEVKLKDEFVWKMHVIDAPTLNAFCAPGGYIYFYTGLLKYLDTEAQVAGVMGHEMAHADCRHSTKQMTKDYGISTLLGILVGDNAGELTKIAAQMAGSLAGLKFSRDDESEADKCAVRYLSKTKYKPTGVAGFFEKLKAEQKGGKMPEFLSTHPSDEHRIAAIHEACEGIDMTGKSDFEQEYKEFKAKYLK